MRNKHILGIALLSCLAFSYPVYSEINSESLKVANWNLQIFGPTKASNQELMSRYAGIIDDYDIVFIQEIRDKDQEAFPKLCSMLKDYRCNVSSRAGRTSMKEQYGIIYKNSINLASLEDYNPDKEDRWERPPIKAIFDYKGYNFTAYNIHTKPSDVPTELSNLEDIVDNKGNVAIMGDLNADCSYYNSSEKHFSSWSWLVKDSDDTTISSTDCAYDRIIVNSDLNNEVKSHGIRKSGIDKDMSDHYVVWMKIKSDDKKKNFIDKFLDIFR